MTDPLTNLLLIPTQRELTVLQPFLAPAGSPGSWSIELCGFGPIAAAARTASLLARNRPDHVLLVGIAGAYRADLTVGSAAEFSHVACYGVGAGSGDHHQAASELGWPQWPGGDTSPTIGDVIALAPRGDAATRAAGHLLTCCSASDTTEDVRNRTRQHAQATAEDMEGFGVALACALARIPLRIARGISNMAGDRNQQHWKTEAALHAVAQLARTIMEQES